MLARYRQKDTLPKFLPFLESILVEYNNSAPETKDYRKKDGVLVAIATLYKVRKNDDDDDDDMIIMIIVIN
jgi:hypothetical protein